MAQPARKGYNFKVVLLGEGNFKQHFTTICESIELIIHEWRKKFV